MTLKVVEAKFEDKKKKGTFLPKFSSYPVLEFTESGGDQASQKVLKGPIHKGKQLSPKWNWTCEFYIDDDSTG